MTGLFDRESFDIPCPVCGRTVTKRVADLRRVPTFDCPTSACAGTFDATKLLAGLKDVDDGLSGLGGTTTINIKL